MDDTFEDTQEGETREPRNRIRLERTYSRYSSKTEEDQVDALPKEIEFSWLDQIAILVSIGSYIFDTCTDGLIAFFHHRDGNTAYFALTLAFIIIPTITMTAFSLRWYIMDSKEPKAPKVSNLQWTVRVFFLLLQLGPILRYVDAFLFGRKVKKSEDGEDRTYNYECMTYEDADASLLRLFESFLEAAPQLVLQIYIMAQPVDIDDSKWTIYIQTVGVIGSLTSLAWSLVAQHRTMRLSLRDSKNLSWKGTVVMFLWRFFVVASRVIALGLFASIFPYHFAWIMALRWIIMTSWIISLKTEFCDSKCEEYIYNSVLGAIFLFCYFNPKNDDTRWRYIIYYFYTFTENAILMGVWYAFSPQDLWYRFPAVTSHFLSFFMGLVFMALYYLLLHPSKKSKLLSLNSPVYHHHAKNGKSPGERTKYKDNISNSSTLPEVGLFEPPISDDFRNQSEDEGSKNQNSYLQIMAQIHNEKPIGTAV